MDFKEMTKSEVQKYLRVRREFMGRTDKLRERTYTLTSRLNYVAKELEHLQLGIFDGFFLRYSEEINEIADELRVLIYILTMESKKKKK